MRFILAFFMAIISILKEFALYCVALSFFMLIALLICDIEAQEHYSWFSGIWHGIFVIPNYVRSILNPEVLYKAQNSTSMYNILWWIAIVMQIPEMIYILYDVILKPIIFAFFAAEQLKDEF